MELDTGSTQQQADDIGFQKGPQKPGSQLARLEEHAWGARPFGLPSIEDLGCKDICWTSGIRHCVENHLSFSPGKVTTMNQCGLKGQQPPSPEWNKKSGS